MTGFSGFDFWWDVGFFNDRKLSESGFSG